MQYSQVGTGSECECYGATLDSLRFQACDGSEEIDLFGRVPGDLSPVNRQQRQSAVVIVIPGDAARTRKSEIPSPNPSPLSLR